MHQTKPTTKSRHTSVEENQSFHAIQYLPSTNTMYGTKIEPWNENHVDTHKAYVMLYWSSLQVANLLAGMGETSKLGWICQIWCKGWFVVFPIPAVTYNFRYPGFIQAYTMTFSISMLGQFWFFTKTVWDCAYVCRAAWLVVCLFHQHTFCHIHTECYRCSMLIVLDLFLVWFSMCELVRVSFVLKIIPMLWEFPVCLKSSEMPCTLEINTELRGFSLFLDNYCLWSKNCLIDKTWSQIHIQV
jgi:hypothetical protein